MALAALAASVTCPYCKAHVELRPDEVERLVRYRHEVRGRLDAAHRELGHAESWNRWYGSPTARKKNNTLVAVGIWLGLVVTVALLSFGVQALGLERHAVAKLAPLGLFGLFALAFGGYLVWFYSGRGGRSAKPALASARVSCPKCGAPNELHPGEVLQHCRFCGAPLLAGRRAMEHGLAEAERALLFAELERARAERRGMTALSASSGARVTPYIVVGSFLPMTLLGAVAFTISFLTGHEEGPLSGLLLLWAFAGANVGLLGLVYAYRRHRNAQLEAVLGAISTRLGGTLSPDPWAMNAWLDRHWAGPVPMQQMFRGPYFRAAFAQVEGFPLLVVANPVGASEHYPGFVSVRLGAWMTSPEAARGAATATARAAFERLGFSLSFERSGPVALALNRAARRFVGAGDGAALADAIARLAASARELGAQPVDVA